MPKDRPHRYLAELEELREWSLAREYWDRAIEHMKLALDTTDPDERKRLIAIAQHYRELAKATERSADRKGAERRGENDCLKFRILGTILGTEFGHAQFLG